MDLTKITDDCLERLARGETIADCLARYPEAADQLAPILSAAEQLRVLSQAHLTNAQRLRAKVALREELAVRGTRHELSKRGFGIVSWGRLRTAPFVAVVALVLFMSIAFTAVAASQPGDLVYPVRVAVERAPALVQLDAARRAEAELAVADRRLADLARDQDRDAVAVDALLRSDLAAVEQADGLSDSERAIVLAHVQYHVKVLASLANQAVDAQIGARLRAAVAAEQALARQLEPVVDPPEPARTATSSPVSPTPALVPVGGIATLPSSTQTEAPAAAPTIMPSPTVPDASATAPSASATPSARPQASVVPPSDSRTPNVPPPKDSTPWPPGDPPRPQPTVVPPRATVVHPTVVPPRATVVHPTVVPPRVTVVHPTKVPKDNEPTVVVPKEPPRATVVHPTVVPPRVTVVHPTKAPKDNEPTVVVPKEPPRATVVHPTILPPGDTEEQSTAVPPRATVVHPTKEPKDVEPTVVVPKEPPGRGPHVTPVPVATPIPVDTPPVDVVQPAETPVPGPTRGGHGKGPP